MTERPGDVTHKGNPLTVIGDKLQVGDKAPDFALATELFSTATVTLSESTGKVRLISVVPSLDTGICDAQTRRFNEEIAKYGEKERAVSEEALDMLATYHWPGNIRELKSVITKVLIFAESNVISADDLPRHLSADRKAPVRRPKTLEEMEKDHIVAVLAETGGNQSRAAEILGINRKTLYKKIHKFKIFS